MSRRVTNEIMAACVVLSLVLIVYLAFTGDDPRVRPCKQPTTESAP